MFILDSLFLSGFKWVLNTVATAADAEMNDDTALREELLNAEMRREMGELSDEEFAELEADLLARIREIRERREGGSGPIAFGTEPIETSPDRQFAIEATISGDFHEPAREPVALEVEPVTAGDASGTVIQGTLVEPKVDARTRGTSRRKATGTKRTTGTATRRPRQTSRTLRTSGTFRSSRSARKIR
jgi:hypothetical protein